ncbi:MAG: hypothetical protein HKN05_00205 [Rhizobiales bacterium]|nr:hypothetical protein [Hyphomicrobiales bacterium]
MLDRKAILSADDIPKGDLEIPEWGGTIQVRGFNARERTLVTEMYLKAQKEGRIQPKSIHAIVAVWCVLNGSGPMFTDDDIEALEAKSPEALDRIAVKVQELSGMSEKDLEAAVKN